MISYKLVIKGINQYPSEKAGLVRLTTQKSGVSQIK